MAVPKILGVMFVVLGLAFVAWGVAWTGSDLFGAAGISLVVTGVVFFVCAVGMFVLSGRLKGVKRADDQLARTGVPGQATVLSMRDTGISLRSGTELIVAFDLQVQLPGRAPYLVSTQQGIPRIVLGGILPGSLVNVRVDPADPQQVAIDFRSFPMPGGTGPGGMPMAGGMPAGGMPAGGVVGGIPAGGPAGGPPRATPGGMPIARTERAADLLATGTPAWATVLAAQDLGMDVSQTGLAPASPDQADDRIYLFDLEVHLDGQPPYTARIGHRVPDSMLGQLQPGMSLRVAVDPANPTTSVAIDWGVG